MKKKKVFVSSYINETYTSNARVLKYRKLNEVGLMFMACFNVKWKKTVSMLKYICLFGVKTLHLKATSADRRSVK